MSGGLRPCPFCGSDHLTVRSDPKGESSVECPCGARLVKRRVPVEVLLWEWNGRERL